MLSIAALTATPPVLESSFCTDVVQWKMVNSSLGPLPPGPYKPGHAFHMCLDTPAKRFSMHGVVVDMVSHKVFEAWHIYNGTDMFNLTPNASAPGGYQCGFISMAVDPQADPFAYVVIDDEATPGPPASIDGLDGVQTWLHARPRHGAYEGGNMTWFVLPGGPGGAPRLLRTSYLQYSLMKNHTADANDGQRDFSSNYTKKTDGLEPPAGVVCTRHAQPPPRAAVAFFA